MFTRIIELTPAYDKRATNRGVHGVDLRMVLKGDKGATQFILFTHWHTAEIMESWRSLPMPADLGYHSPVPRYPDQHKTLECPYVEGGCYYDGSTLAAERIFDVLVKEGSDGVWRELEAYYKVVFGD